MISADDLFMMTAVIVSGAAFAFWAESQRCGRHASGPVWAILFGVLLSNLGFIPASAPAYSLVSDLLVPAAIPLLLFKANIRKIVAESGPMLIAFFIGVIGATAGAIIGYKLLPLGENAEKLAGGSTESFMDKVTQYAEEHKVDKATALDACVDLYPELHAKLTEANNATR